MTVMTLASKEMDCEIHMVREGNETFSIRVWKPLPSKRVLKLLGKPRKEKPKEDNIC